MTQHTYSELLGIRMYAKETKQRLSNLYGMLVSNDLQCAVFNDAVFLGHEFDKAGLLCDHVWETVDSEIKRMDKNREKIKMNEEVYEPRSRWEL
jgi:hypothetical protein